MQLPGKTSIVWTAVLIGIGLSCLTVLAQDHQHSQETAIGGIDFGRDVQPIFAGHCYSCHGPDQQESNFRLDARELALGTADLGDPPIIPGNGSDSPLVRFISAADPDLVMPPEHAGSRLTADQIDVIRRWIDEGAVWPDDWAGEAELKLSTDHWSFQPINDHHEPPGIDAAIQRLFPLRNGIDHFVADRLARAGIEPSRPADRVTLIRRIYLDMHGLHPSPETVAEFVNDRSDDAWAKVIDNVLNSPHYGGRWARHWLDVVRFGESTGYEVNRDRANAWYYRDYVIDALNEDKSYRDFIIEQIAGDAVGVDEATGFLVGGPHDIVKSPDVNLTLMQRQDELADFVNTTSTTFLGLTVGCARCHNHKFDPIRQHDYFALQAVFAGVEHGERKLESRVSADIRKALAQLAVELQSKEERFAALRDAAPQPDPSDETLLPAVDAKMNTDVFDPVEARMLRFTVRRTNSAEPCLDELEVYSVADQRNVALASSGSRAVSSGNYSGNPKHQLQHINDGKYGNDFSWIADTHGSGWVQIEFSDPILIDRVVWGRDRQGMFADRLPVEYSVTVSSDGSDWQEVAGSARRKPFLIDGKEPEDAFIARLPDDDAARARSAFDEIQRLRKEISELNQSIPMGYVGTFKEPGPIRRLHRGDPLAPRETVLPDTLSVLATLGLNADTPEQTRRLELARWIASDSNPLTARVIVNRVWQYHFGRGLVATPSDFGNNGAKPTHPRLLDYLASQFMQHGWSLKWLHRQILASSTYQQSSLPRSAAMAEDAQCRLLWRFPPRRLEAEAIRDCVLQLAGTLNLERGGPGFLLFEIDRENVHHYFPLDKFEAEHFRRMIYMTKIRQEHDAVFGVFDCPDGGQTIPRRSRSTTALQALNLFNSRFMIEQANYLAERLRTSAGDQPADQIRLAFQLAFSRPPNAQELQDAMEFVEQHQLEAFCRALLNTNEFVFVS